MANEVKVGVSLTYAKNGKSFSAGKQGVQIDVSGDDYIADATQNIGTSEEAVSIGDITTEGILVIQNNDATNFVSLYGANGETAFAKIKPGDPPFIYRIHPDSTLYAKADTGACQISYTLIED